MPLLADHGCGKESTDNLVSWREKSKSKMVRHDVFDIAFSQSRQSCAEEEPTNDHEGTFDLSRSKNV